MSVKLTQRQQQVLDLIRSEIQRTGFPPTRAELAQSLGFRSANAAEDHLRALARKGAIVLTRGTSRGIRLTDQAPPAAHASGSTHAIDQLLLPVVGRVAAGNPILAQQHIENEISVQPSLFSKPPHYLLKVRGASMRNAGILDGDLLAVHKTPDAHNGQIIVARLGEEVTVKRFSKSKNRIQLLPENPDFDPIPVGPADDFTIEGLAVGLIRTQAS